MSNAVAGPGWILAHAGTTVAEVRDISGPEQKAEKDDVTNQSSPNFYREWITTLLDGGDVSFAANYIPGDASQTALLTALQARGVEAFTITPPSPNASHVISFNGRVTDFSSKFPVAKAAMLDIKIAVTGPVTIA